jgi:cytochrome bd ubiquinol oxidase subunit II
VGRAVLTAVIFTVQPQVTTNFKTWSIGYIFPLLAVAGPAGVPVELRRKNQLNAFLASCVYLLGMLTSVVFGVYPMVLPARYPTFALTVENAKASDYGLKIGLIWWVIGVALATVYFVHVDRSFAGEVPVQTDGQGHGD